TLVEAKKEDLTPGLGQCAAEMVGARLFNERAGTAMEVVYGAVTSGTGWRFLSLSGSTLSVDLREDHISEVDRLLGILTFTTSPQGGSAPTTRRGGIARRRRFLPSLRRRAQRRRSPRSSRSPAGGRRCRRSPGAPRRRGAARSPRRGGGPARRRSGRRGPRRS